MKTKRTPLKDRILPDYTKGEEIFNMVSHIVGGVFGIVALTLCVAFSILHKDPWAIVGSSIYGLSLVMLYTMSAIYHGLHVNIGKKVFQVLDHCTIFFLIAGTYTPIVLGPIRRVSPGWGWTIFGIVWVMSIIGIVCNAIDLKKYSKFSMICYIGIGWCIVLAIKPAFEGLAFPAIMWILAGGISYTIGAVLYGLGKKKRYMHSIFHIFVLIGSILQFIAIFCYVI